MYAEHIVIRVLSDLRVVWLTLWVGVRSQPSIKVFSTVYSASSCQLKLVLQKRTDNVLISKGKLSTAHSSITSLDLGCAIKSLPVPPTQLT